MVGTSATWPQPPSPRCPLLLSSPVLKESVTIFWASLLLPLCLEPTRGDLPEVLLHPSSCPPSPDNDRCSGGMGIQHNKGIVFLFLPFHNTHPSGLTPVQSPNRNLPKAYYVPSVLVGSDPLIHSPCWGWPGPSLLQSSVSTQKENLHTSPFTLSPAPPSHPICPARSLA